MMVRRVETGNDAIESVSLTPLVYAWLLGGLLALSISMVAGGVVPTLNPTFLLLLGLTAVAETTAVKLQAGRSSLSLSLLEIVVVVALLMLPPASAVTAVVAGIAVSHVFQRIGVQKIAFNVGQHAAAGSIAAAIVAIAPTTPTISSGRMAAAMVGMLAYSITNSIALAGVFSRLGLASFRDQLTQRPLFLVGTSIGNASVGAMTVALWSAYPTSTWIIAGPILALYLSYGSSFRIESLLSEVSSERDHLDRVVSGVQEGIVLLDADGLVRLWNPAMTRITGIPESDALGRSSTSLLSGVDADGATVDPGQVLRDHLPAAVAVVALSHTSGDRIDTRIEHTLVEDDRGRCVGDVVLVQDLSREREAHALKEDFVARVSHELRTPLSPLRGYAQILLDAGDRVPAEKRTMMLQTMVERVGHLERLIEDLLLVSKVASGELSPRDEATAEAADVGEIVSRMSSWVDRDHPERDIRIDLGDEGHVAWADSLRVGQIVTNLVKNACKYATPGTPVDVTVRRTGDDIRVDVRDHGPGIPEDKLETIFDRFQRLDDPQRMQTSGLGLGLYIARHLATTMGGRLDVASARGHGSTFSLTLPAATLAQAAAAVDAPPRASGSRVHRREEALTGS